MLAPKYFPHPNWFLNISLFALRSPHYITFVLQFLALRRKFLWMNFSVKYHAEIQHSFFSIWAPYHIVDLMKHIFWVVIIPQNRKNWKEERWQFESFCLERKGSPSDWAECLSPVAKLKSDILLPSNGFVRDVSLLSNFSHAERCQHYNTDIIEVLK